MSDTNVDNSVPATDTVAASTTVASVPGSTDTPASTTGPADTAASGQPTDGTTGEPPKEPSRDRRAEKRIASLTRKNEELLTRLGRLEGIVEVTASRPQQQAAEADAKPQPNQFKSYDDYVEALTDWKTDQKLSAREKQQAEQGRNQEARSKVDERNARVAERLAEAGTAIEDFDEVMETITNPRFPVSTAMRDYLEDCEHPAHMAQWMAENREEARRIYGMNSVMAVRELDKVAAKVAPKTQPKTSSAPPPVPTVGGRAVTTRDPEKMDMAEYASVWKARQAKTH